MAAGLARGVYAVPDAPPPVKYAGTYRIQSWRALERKGIHQFFYLHPKGLFVLAAEWPGYETSRFVGHWEVREDRLILRGSGWVDTNRASWRVPFARTYLISLEPNGFLLRPLPENNRYGLMGWPDAYVFYRSQPAPNLPSGDIPAGEDDLRAWIQAQLKKNTAGE